MRLFFDTAHEFRGEDGGVVSLMFDSRLKNTSVVLGIREGSRFKAASVEPHEAAQIRDVLPRLFSESKGDLRIHCNELTLRVSYDNRGDPYREGVAVEFSYGTTSIFAFIEFHEARRLLSHMEMLFPAEG
jgi:hypothetical protein